MEPATPGAQVDIILAYSFNKKKSTSERVGGTIKNRGVNASKSRGTDPGKGAKRIEVGGGV